MAWEVDEVQETTQAANAAQDVLQDIESSHEESVRQEQEVMETLSEAVKRIEEANLWKTLLTLDVFQQGSARPEIVESANKKIRAFARQNLESCVGINQKEAPPQKIIQEVKLPFDREEMQALKILAAKVLKRDVTQAILQDYSPTVSTVTSVAKSGPTVNTVQAAGQVKTQQAPSVNMAPKTAAKVPQKKKTAQKPGAGYIPPTSGYIPPIQGGATVTTEGLPQQTNMNNLVSQLIQQASGGNIVAQNTTSADGGDDVNERF